MKDEREIRDRIAVLNAPPDDLGKTGRLMWVAAAEALEWALGENPEMGLQAVLDERERQHAGRT